MIRACCPTFRALHGARTRQTPLPPKISTGTGVNGLDGLDGLDTPLPSCGFCCPIIGALGLDGLDKMRTPFAVATRALYIARCSQ